MTNKPYFLLLFPQKTKVGKEVVKVLSLHHGPKFLQLPLHIWL